MRKMSDPKWTPGPWKWDDTVWDYDREEQAPWLVTERDDARVLWGEVKCSEPNAHLIAAAPDLYEALEALVLAQETAGTDGREADRRRAAIAALKKARGEP